jgi:hypothetical protein
MYQMIGGDARGGGRCSGSRPSIKDRAAQVWLAKT